MELLEFVREYANEALPGTARLDVEVLEFVREYDEGTAPVDPGIDPGTGRLAVVGLEEEALSLVDVVAVLLY